MRELVKHLFARMEYLEGRIHAVGKMDSSRYESSRQPLHTHTRQ